MEKWISGGVANGSIDLLIDNFFAYMGGRVRGPGGALRLGALEIGEVDPGREAP